MKFKGFIFDFDGTLINSMEMWDNSTLDYLKTKGINEISQEIIEKIEPMTTKETAEFLIPHYNLNLTVEQVMVEFFEMVRQKYEDGVTIKDGTIEFLEKYHDIPKCIASTTHSKLINGYLKKNNMEHYFDFVLCTADVGRSKHFPDIYDEAARRMGLTKEEVCVFEDASYAMKTLKDAGYYIAGIYDSTVKDLELAKACANQYVENINDLNLE